MKVTRNEQHLKHIKCLGSSPIWVRNRVSYSYSINAILNIVLEKSSIVLIKKWLENFLLVTINLWDLLEYLFSPIVTYKLRMNKSSVNLGCIKFSCNLWLHNTNTSF